MISSSREPADEPDITSLHVTVDARGNAVLAWVEFTYRDQGSVWTSHAEKGGPWASSRRMDARTGFGDAVLAGNATGDAIVAWIRDGLQVSRLDDGRWTVPRTIAAPRRLSFRSQPAIGTSGDAMVAWLSWDAVGNVVVIWREPEGTWVNRFEMTR